MKDPESNNSLLILDCNSRPLARGILLGSAQAARWTVQVQGDQMSLVTAHQELQLISLSDPSFSHVVRITGTRGDRLEAESLRPLGSEARETLRIPVSFESFIYPLSGDWAGRRPIKAVDLSCTGICFTCSEPLQPGECLEVVIPLRRSPLLLSCQVLRTRSTPSGETAYSLKFTDPCDDADKLLQEFVFNEQIRSQAS
jgi:hypothetical protein